MIEWSDIEKAIQDGSIYKADKATLEKYLHRVTDPPPSINPGFHARAEQIGHTVRQLLASIENEEIKRLSRRNINISCWVLVVSIVAALGAYLPFLLKDENTDTNSNQSRQVAPVAQQESPPKSGLATTSAPSKGESEELLQTRQK